MENIRALQKRYCSRAMAAAIVVALVLIVLGHKPLARGLVLGTFFSIVNFVMMGLSLQARITRDRRHTAIALLSVVFRFALMALPLLIAMFFEGYHIVTAVAGLFMVQVIMLLENLKSLLWKRSTATEIGK